MEAMSRGEAQFDETVDVVVAGSGGGITGAYTAAREGLSVALLAASPLAAPSGARVLIAGCGTGAELVEARLRQEGMVEITEGLASGETVALDGAGYLTDKAVVNVQQKSANQ